MAAPKMILVKRTAIKVPPKGKLAGPLVAITEGGVMTLSVASTKALNGSGVVFFRYYPESRKLEIVPKGHKTLPKDLPDEYGYTLKKAKKSNGVTISGSNSFLQDIGHEVFPAGTTYDFRKSGNQTFEASIEGGQVSFTLPLGVIARKEVVKRAPRKKKVTTTTDTPTTESEPTIEPSTEAEPELIGA